MWIKAVAGLFIFSVLFAGAWYTHTLFERQYEQWPDQDADSFKNMSEILEGDPNAAETVRQPATLRSFQPREYIRIRERIHFDEL